MKAYWPDMLWNSRGFASHDSGANSSSVDEGSGEHGCWESWLLWLWWLWLWLWV
mgnify:CR=1 FL=1